MSLKKMIIRNYLRVQLIKNEPGALYIRMPSLRRLENQFKMFENNVVSLIQLLPGINKIETQFDTGDITIYYDQEQLDARTVMRWINTVIDVGITQIDDIAANWEMDLEGVMKRLTFLLEQKIENNFRVSR